MTDYDYDYRKAEKRYAGLDVETRIKVTKLIIVLGVLIIIGACL
jgi:hypothetical protein